MQGFWLQLFIFPILHMCFFWRKKLFMKFHHLLVKYVSFILTGRNTSIRGLVRFFSLSLSVSLRVCLSLCISLSVCLWLSLCICISLCISCPVCLSLSLFLYLSVSVYLSVSLFLSVCLSVSLSLCLSFSLSISLSLMLHDETRQSEHQKGLIQGDVCKIKASEEHYAHEDIIR